ncbi:hypothetical protein FXO38_09526 [Capsicum annuum]|nr:hypothetical protein FXO38_09526 [Capsicum annuum]
MYAMPTNTSCLSLEIPSNTLPTEGENQVADFEQSVPSRDVRHPNELSCSSSKSHPVTTRSQTVKPVTIRLLLSLDVSNNWYITQLYISNAFLYVTLDEVVCMSQPPGFVDPDRPKYVCLLKHCLYGLKQALHELLILGSSSSLVDSLITCLKSQFSVRDLGRLSYFWGLKHHGPPTGLHLSQHQYATNLLWKAQMVWLQSYFYTYSIFL